MRRRNNNAQELQTVEVRQWEGGTPPDLQSFLQRKTKLHLPNYKNMNGVICFDLRPRDANELVKWNNVYFSGRKLSIKFRPNQETSQTMQLLNSILEQRYSQPQKLLNFSMMMSDPNLQQSGLISTPQTAVKMFQALLKVASDMNLLVESISLESNNLMNTEIVEFVGTQFPKLLNLSLANNSIMSVESLKPLKNKFKNLRELVLQGNPVQQSPQILEILQFFPTLMILDGQQVRTEADLPKFALPMPVQTSFFADKEVELLVASFLPNFFNLWDTQRQQLHILYDNQSLFSLNYNSQVPHLPTKPPPQSYPKQSRNLLKNHGAESRHHRIKIGVEQIFAEFNLLPPTKHDLTKFECFQTEAWKVSDVRLVGDTAIMMCVHGEFLELETSTQRSFDRSLVVLPANGGYVIASDMLTVRPLGMLPMPQQPVQPVQPVQQQVPVQQPVPMQPVQPVPPTQALEELMRQTNMKREFAEMCLQQANFDLQQALVLFEQSRAQLGPEAFN